MTTPKIKTLHSQGSRWYIHPEDPDQKVPGVTSVLNMAPKPFLKPWAAKVVATSAVENIDYVAMMAKRDPEGTIDYLKRAPDRDTQSAADRGSGAHSMFERLLWGESFADVTRNVVDTLIPYAANFAALLDELQPTPLRTEDTVWSATHRYAGSFDGLVEIQGDRAWTDNKTNRSGIYKETALQLSAYAHADYVLDSDTGEELKLPQAEHGLIFHVRPDFWAVYEPPIGDDVFEYFLALRKVFDLDRMGHSVIGRPIMKGAA